MVCRDYPRCLGHPFRLLNTTMTHTQLVVWSGFILGLLFGVVGQRTHYCTAGGLREWWREDNPRRAAALVIALSFALLGTQLSVAFGGLDVRPSIYRQSSFSWLLMPLGGLLFGYGMMLARGCGSRALVLLASGNLRSLVVLLALGVAAAITLTGPLAPWRLTMTEWTLVSWATVSVPELFYGGDPVHHVARLLPVAILVAVLLRVALVNMKLYRHPWEAAGAALIGLLVPAGWWVTGHWGADDFEPVPVESLTFVAPISDAIQYLMLSTGIRAGFGVTVVAGVLLGACATALCAREFQLRGFDSPRHMLRFLAGGVMMGVGGALALGCTIGQGLTGLSTLAFPSFLAVAGILLGAWLSLRGPLRIREQTAV